MFKLFKKIYNRFKEASQNNNLEKGIAPLVMLLVGILAVDLGSSLLAGTAKELAKGVLWLILVIAQWAFGYATALFASVTSSAFLAESIINGNTAVTAGWQVVRDFSNMFVVLGFVVVGIATILRLQEYQAQKKLVPLILVAIILNFSPTLCGLFIDGSNITMNYFINTGSASNLVQTFQQAIDDPAAQKQIVDDEKSDDLTRYAQDVLLAAAFAGIAAMIFFLFSVLFLFRHVALMLLVILAPLGIVCFVFDKTKPVWQKWSEQFIQWCFIGIPSAFILYITAYILNSTAGSGTIASFWVPVGFMMFGYSLCFSTTAMGASAAMGLATGALATAWGTTKKAGKWAGGSALSKAKGTATGQKVTSAIGRTMEGFGLQAAGTTAGNAAAGVAEAQKRLKNLDSAQLARHVGQGRGRTGLAEADYAAGMKELAARGDLSQVPFMVGDSDADKVLAGDTLKRLDTIDPSIRKEMEKANPNLARLDDRPANIKTGDKGGKITKLMSEEGLTRGEAEEKAVKQRVQGLTGNEIAGLHHSILKDPKIFQHISNRQITSFGKNPTVTEEQRAAVRSHVAGVETEYAPISEEAVGRTATSNYQQRMNPANVAHPVYGVAATHAKIRAAGLTPDTAEADQFMKDQDWKDAEVTLGSSKAKREALQDRKKTLEGI